MNLKIAPSVWKPMNGITYADNERDKRVQKRNRVAEDPAKKYDLPVIDLYSVSKENAHLHFSDGIHFLPEGYQLFADEILKCVNGYMH